MNKKLANFNKASFINKLLLVVLFGVLAGTVYVMGDREINKYTQAWDAVQFAVREPDLVRALEEDYQVKTADLKKSYTAKPTELTPEQKLVNAVAEEVQGKE